MLASFTSTDSESENPPLWNPLRFMMVENRSSRDLTASDDLAVLLVNFLPIEADLSFHARTVEGTHSS